MKFLELFEARLQPIKNDHGVVYFQWRTKKDLENEEHEGYIPKGYTKILELEEIKAKAIGKGHGEPLMKTFLESPAAKEADLIFLDLSPYVGTFIHKSPEREEDVMKKLEKFYKKFGFRNRRSLSRMWRVQKGTIPDSELPE